MPPLVPTTILILIGLAVLLWLISANISGPIKNILNFIVILIAILWFLSAFGIIDVHLLKNLKFK